MRTDYSCIRISSLDTSPEWKSEKKRLNSVKEAVVSALSLKAHALMDRLSTQAIGASDVTATGQIQGHIHIESERKSSHLKSHPNHIRNHIHAESIHFQLQYRYIERLHERIAQSLLFFPVDLSMRAECMHEK